MAVGTELDKADGLLAGIEQHLRIGDDFEADLTGADRVATYRGTLRDLRRSRDPDVDAIATISVKDARFTELFWRVRSELFLALDVAEKATGLISADVIHRKAQIARRQSDAWRNLWREIERSHTANGVRLTTTDIDARKTCLLYATQEALRAYGQVAGMPDPPSWMVTLGTDPTGRSRANGKKIDLIGKKARTVGADVGDALAEEAAAVRRAAKKVADTAADIGKKAATGIGAGVALAAAAALVFVLLSRGK